MSFCHRTRCVCAGELGGEGLCEELWVHTGALEEGMARQHTERGEELCPQRAAGPEMVAVTVAGG